MVLATPPAGWRWVLDPSWESGDGEREWVLERIPDYVAPADPNLSRNPDGSLTGSQDDVIARTVAKRAAQARADEEYARLTGAVYDYTMKRDYVNGVYQGTPNDNQVNPPTPGSSAYVLSMPSKFTPRSPAYPVIKTEPPYAGNVKLPVQNPWQKIMGRTSKWSWKR